MEKKKHDYYSYLIGSPSSTQKRFMILSIYLLHVVYSVVRICVNGIPAYRIKNVLQHRYRYMRRRNKTKKCVDTVQYTCGNWQ